ncbi:MAG: glutamate 5-kinase, partial [Alphaproteobacteria bacterium]|nr:glutamate 5-kinase [Alphaproteobacteria bacterium]
LAGKGGSDHGTGGMHSKILAAEMCLGSNCHMIIASGQQQHALARIRDGAACSVFQAEGTPIQARKRWLSGLLTPAGQVVIDTGAVRAVLSGKSLLAAGVSGQGGSFQRGDAVAIVNQAGRVMGHGLINYSDQELALIKGRKSADIVRYLGFVRENTLIHRDNFMLRERG